MSDGNGTLADFAAFEISGPATVFVRPREEISSVTAVNLSRQLERISKGSGLCYILVPHDFDILVAGDAELAAAGLCRIAAEGG